MAPDVVALGEPLLEFNATTPGTLQQVRAYEVGYGGDTSNFIVAAARMGASTGYLTRLGDDDFGRIFLDLWQAEGVDTSKVILDPLHPTGIYFISRTGKVHSFTYYRTHSAASFLAPQDIPQEYISAARVLHTSGISQAISNSACDAVFHAVDIARRAGVRVSYDPNVRLKLWSPGRARSIIIETIRQADFIFPSLEDARFITGYEQPEKMAEFFLELGPQVVALKLGDQGALLATQDGFLRIPPYRVELFDATGAGDTFAGAFIAAWLRGCDYADCARFANTAAALSTQGKGAVNPIPPFAAVEAALASES